MATIVSRGGILYIKFYDPRKGYTRRQSTKLKDNPAGRSEAKKRLKLFAPDMVPSEFVSIRSKKLSTGLNEYLDYKNYKKNTENIYRYSVKQLIAASGDKFISEYSNRDYVKLKNYLKRYWQPNGKKKKPVASRILLSVNTKSIVTRTLHSLFAYFVENKYCTDNIIEAIPYEEKVIRSISSDELDLILSRLKNDKHYALIYFLVNTGVRIGTALDLTWDDIDFKKKIITFKNIKVKNTSFTFPLIDRLESVLLTIGPGKPGEQIFKFKSRHSTRFFDRTIADLGLKYSIHKLKSTFISEAIKQGMSLEALSELTNTTMRTLKKHYTNLNKEFLASSLNKIKIVDSKLDSKLYESSAI